MQKHLHSPPGFRDMSCTFLAYLTHGRCDKDACDVSHKPYVQHGSYRYSSIKFKEYFDFFWGGAAI